MELEEKKSRLFAQEKQSETFFLGSLVAWFQIQVSH